MKFVFATVVALVAIVLILMYGSASSSTMRRSRFIKTMNALKEAHAELHQFGGFTNYFRDMSVYPFTNRFTIGPTNYQCEFAVETGDFKERGFLTITTNGAFVWVDKNRGLIPLSKPSTFPPGL